MISFGVFMFLVPGFISAMFGHDKNLCLSVLIQGECRFKAVFDAFITGLR